MEARTLDEVYEEHVEPGLVRYWPSAERAGLCSEAVYKDGLWEVYKYQGGNIPRLIRNQLSRDEAMKLARELAEEDVARWDNLERQREEA